MIGRRTAIRLSDGRELIYFDEHPATDRTGTPDTRDLPPPPPTAQLRYDPLVDEWVAVAAHRQTRTFLPPSDKCPLCPSTPDFASEIPAPDYDVVVFENQFPSFSDRVAPDEAAALTDLVPVKPGIGRCEVVCFTSDHTSSFGALPPQRVRTVLDALADRTTEMSALPGVVQVFPFENRGVEIGVTLSHPHGQIYAYPTVPPRTAAMLSAARRHISRTGRNLYADVLAAERKAEIRIVGTNEHWTAFVPAASRWPYEVHVAPHRHVPDISALTAEERDAFAPLYLDVLRRFDGLFDKPMPYIAAWHQAVTTGSDRDLGYLHLQLFSIRRAADKLKYLAGSESAMGAFVNDIEPERAAELLRNHQA
ncbi:galactose-1-phosphate uridylyltransferase [Actinoplanes sp. NPDC051859]|uniref:galactose-1-phosphate uridylyltransferase n=1 Tax=Actinoplanes sp. NPDC051859 TaxID=3363909 RepID=UPI0037A0F030